MESTGRVDGSEDDGAWTTGGTRRVESAYAAEDSIYELWVDAEVA